MAAVLLALDNAFNESAEVVAEIHRNDSRRSLVSAESVVVACGSYGDTEQILILVNRLYDSCEEELELQVILGILAGIEKILAGVG